MWIPLVIASAVFLGLYDVCKKTSLKENAVLAVMVISSGMSLLMFAPLLIDSVCGFGWFAGTMFETPKTNAHNQMYIILKAFIVESSWLCNFWAMKYLPISIVGPVRSSAPAWTLLGAVLILGERLNAWQWLGAAIILTCLYLYARSGRKEGISFSHNKFAFLLIAGTLIGAASALYDKYLLRTIEMDRMEMQAWFSFYQFLIAAILAAVIWYPHREKTDKFQFRISIPLVGVLLTVADFLYFYGLSHPEAMIGIVSLIRRSNVVISFLAGAVLFHEKNILQKSLILCGVLAGVAVLCLAK